MGTQIFINPDGCRVEYTKIAAHSFSFGPKPEENTNGLFYGGYNGTDEVGNPTFATWSRDIFNYNNDILAPSIKISDKAVGIPLPIYILLEYTNAIH